MSDRARWVFPEAVDAAAVARLVHDAQIAPWVAECLVRRGLSEAEVATRFLQPRLRTLSDPFLLSGMDAAITRILTALEKRERIVLYGDYDVDGVTSLALLTRLLRAYGAEVPRSSRIAWTRATGFRRTAWCGASKSTARNC